MKFAFYTLGCKTNQYETQAMEQLLREQGHTIAGFDQPCDGYIINTCSVTAVADKKNRAIIRRCRRDNPQAVIGVCGCYPQHAPEDIRALGIDVLGGSGQRQAFLEQMLCAMADRSHHEVLDNALRRRDFELLPPGGLEERTRASGQRQAFLEQMLCAMADRSHHEVLDNALRRRDFELLPPGGLEERTRAMLKVQDGCVNFCSYCIIPYTRGPLDNALRRRDFELLPPGGLEERTRAMLKVQDGCVNFCSYCIIPYTRGPIRSAPLDVAVAQAQALAEQGYLEIVLTGIEIASWGADLPGKPEVTELICAVCQAVPNLRIRLGSLEPRIVTEDFCRRLAALPNLCPQFHLSMQSGCDSVLQRMRRKYDTARYASPASKSPAGEPICPASRR